MAPGRNVFGTSGKRVVDQLGAALGAAREADLEGADAVERRAVAARG